MHILLSQTKDPWRKCHTPRSRCACVWKYDDHDYSIAWYDSFSTFIWEHGYVSLFFLTFFLWTFLCPHFFLFFSFSILFHSSCLICKDCGERSCMKTWIIYLVEMERHVFAYFQCRSIAYIWWSVHDLDLKSMIEFSTQVNKVWQISKQKQVAYVEGFQHIAWYLALVGNLTIEEKRGY